MKRVHDSWTRFYYSTYIPPPAVMGNEHGSWLYAIPDLPMVTDWYCEVSALVHGPRKMEDRLRSRK
jgi:hypothetical protein